MRSGWWLAVAVGCGFPPGDVVDVAGESCLLATPGGWDARDAVDDTADSYEHVATCVDLAGQLDDALDGALGRSVDGDEGPPTGFTSTDDGYVSSDGARSTRVTYLLGRDTERAGSAGDPVPADLFTLSSYLVGARPTVTADGVSIAYDRVGPLVELLGKGAAPPNPLRLSTEELAFPTRLQELEVVVTVQIDEQMPSGVVSHLITTPATPRTERAADAPWRLQVHTVLESDAGTLTGDGEDLLFRPNARTFTGEVLWELLGGKVEAGGSYGWVDSADPLTTVACY